MGWPLSAIAAVRWSLLFHNIGRAGAGTCVTLWMLLWVIHITAIIYGRWRLYRRWSPSATQHGAARGVSILKPLTGCAENLEENLHTFFTLSYPEYELLFCLNEENNALMAIISDLMRRYPDVAARVFIGGKKIGINPKLNNMMPGYEAARHDLIMVSDSSMRMRKHSLTVMVEAMTHRVALVHQLPFTCDKPGFCSALEKVYFGTAHARIYLVADLLGINCCNGMSSLMRRDALESVGGLPAFSHYIAEDYFMAQAIIRSGWKTSICSEPGWQYGTLPSIQAFLQRMIRWTKLRVAMHPSNLILEPMSECLTAGLLAVISITYLLGLSAACAASLYVTHVAAWAALDYTLLSTLQCGPLPFSRLDFLRCWLLREISTYYVFVAAVISPTLSWGCGATYRLRWGGAAIECHKKK